MAWWAWIVVGVMLLGSELAFIDAQFYSNVLQQTAAQHRLLGAELELFGHRHRRQGRHEAPQHRQQS